MRIRKLFIAWVVFKMFTHLQYEGCDYDANGELSKGDIEVELLLIKWRLSHDWLLEGMWHHIEDWTKDKKQGVVPIMFLLYLGISYVDEVDDDCDDDDKTGGDMHCVMIQIHAAGAK